MSTDNRTFLFNSLTLDQGADAIDMVISRGRFHRDDFQYVYDEFLAVKDACSTARLKTILETGELGPDAARPLTTWGCRRIPIRGKYL